MSVRLLEKIDELCELFEDSQQSPAPQPVESFVPSTWPETDRVELVRHLLRIELEYRTRRGEPVSPRELRARFADMPEVVEEAVRKMPATHATVSRQSFLQDLEDCKLLSKETLEQIVSSVSTFAGADDIAVELVRQNQLTHFQAQALCQGNAHRIRLGNYWLLDLIGKGGMGEVYRAKHHQMQRLVALKVLPSSFMQHSEAVQRFEREIVAIARVTHPNVVTAYDAGQANGVHYLVMEYVEGTDLRELVKTKGPLSVVSAINVVLQAARGLEAAHRAGIVHRDVKPANLLLDSSGTVKVLDLGLARLSSLNNQNSSGALTRSGLVVGTPDFMAPEQARRSASADERSDVYSLGCTLFFLLTGRGPYEGGSRVKQLFAHREQPIPDLNQFCRDIPLSLAHLFQKLLAKKPDDRIPTMTAVIQALEAIHVQEIPDSEQTKPRPQVVLSDSPPLKEAGTDQAGADQAGKDVVITDRRKAPQIKVAGPRGRRQNNRLTRGLVLTVLPILAGIVIAVRTNSGRLVVEIDPADATVTVLDKNGEIKITREGGGEKVTLNVEPGTHHISVSKEGFTPYAEAFEMSWWGNHNISATLEPIPTSETVPTSEPIPAVAFSGKLYMHDPGFSKWMREVQSMSAEKQLEAVSAKLMELNPGFDGSLVWPPLSDPPRIENGVVVSLQISTEKLSDISPLRSLTGLQSLNCNNGILADLSPLSGMQLTSLALAFNPRIKDLSPLRGLPLRSLNLQGTGVTDLSVINTLPLEVLSLRETAVTDLTPLKGMSLTLLDCHRTTIADLSPLEGMPLRTFSAPANISRLESVQNLPLTLLEIESHTCTDLSPLRGMPLESLIMILPALSDLKPLTGMKLNVVRVISDRVTDVTPLKGMPATIVELRASSLVDLSPLKEMPLERITLAVHPDANVEVLRSLSSLRFINDKPVDLYWSEFDAGAD